MKKSIFNVVSKVVVVVLVVNICLIFAACNHAQPNNNQQPETPVKSSYIELNLDNYKQWLTINIKRDCERIPNPPYNTVFSVFSCLTVNGTNNAFLYIDCILNYRIDFAIYEIKLNTAGFGERTFFEGIINTSTGTGMISKYKSIEFCDVTGKVYLSPSDYHPES